MKATDSMPEEKIVHALVDAASWAPSVHNTQPWWFGTRGSRVTLHADPDRRLTTADPDGREMLISCGAALYTLRLAVRSLGHEPQVELLSDPERPGLIAVRRTHRGGFRPEGLRSGLLQSLRSHAGEEGVMLRIVADPLARAALGALTEAAEHFERQDPAYCVEMARWAPRPGSFRENGVHDHAYPRDPERTEPHYAARDYARGHRWGFTDDERQAATGVVALLTTGTDGRADWLRAGQALQRVLLRASSDGVSAAFHAQALEIPELREVVRARFCEDSYPQMIMRLGVADREIKTVRRPPGALIRPEP
jgi:hypothetical protein